MTTIAELAEDRTVDGVFAVAKKERKRTRAGAPYLALELSDSSGRVEARVWNDVELLDGRFDEQGTIRGSLDVLVRVKPKTKPAFDCVSKDVRFTARA